MTEENKRRWREKPGWTNNCCRIPSPNKSELALASIIKDLGFRFVGNGAFWIGRKNPDFIHDTQLIAIEFFGKRFHRADTGKARRAYLARRGWQMILVRDYHLAKPEILRRRVARTLGGQ